MIDQDAIMARVVARLAAEGRSLYSLTHAELSDRIDASACDLLTESPTFPKESRPAS